ncbi:MAG: hypothetical protein PVI57_06130 [Gemmatimonadota bacterium]|jgi:hypothetical protein
MSGDHEEVLLSVDSVLNIFALANGLDLFRNQSEVPDRTLEWYREGMERRILIRAEGPDRFVITVAASRRRGGVPIEASRPLRPALGADELREGLRTLLAEGVDAANGLTEADLPTEE